MHLVKQNFKCQDCIRPVARRLGLFQANDDYECYSESYVKCFWGLCDNQKSLESFAPKSYGPVITTQPQLQRPIKNMASKQMVLSK